jgi:uncharacterized protein (TIGR02246 family)
MARTPEEIDPAFMEAFNAGNGEALASLYEPGASFVLPTGEVAEGIEAIGQVVKEFLAMEPTIDLRTKRILRSGDTALIYSGWTLSATGPDGNAVEMAGDSRVVVRQQPDETWRFVIDDPGWITG